MDNDTTPAAIRLSDQLGLVVDADVIHCWKVNYGLEKTPHEIAAMWGNWAPSGAVLALRAAVSEIERLRAALTLAAPALEIGCDALRAEAERYHAEMRGYRPHKHQALDDDYKRADLAYQAVVAALGPNAS